jgi:TRAP-type C4-dicarboxylate transport system substrate-binding protein
MWGNHAMFKRTFLALSIAGLVGLLPASTFASDDPAPAGDAAPAVSAAPAASAAPVVSAAPAVSVAPAVGAAPAANPAPVSKAAPAPEPQFVLRFATINSEATASYAKVLVPFARNVEKESGGRIQVALKPLGGYGKPNELFNMVEKGDIEIAATVQGYNPGRFPQSSVMELPLMYESSIAGTRAMMSLYKEGLLDKDYTSVKVLALYVLPPYPIFTTGKKLQTVRDFRGLRIRTPSVTVGLALRKLGAIPLGVPINLIGDTLDAEIVDAIAYGWDSLTTTKGAKDKVLADQVSVALDANLAAPALMVVMNKARWDALPAELKTVIEKHAADLSDGSARIREEMEAVSKKKIMTDPRFTSLAFTEQQRSEMERVIAPAIQDWKTGMTKIGVDGDKLYKRARELVHQSKVAAK